MNNLKKRMQIYAFILILFISYFSIDHFIPLSPRQKFNWDDDSRSRISNLVHACTEYAKLNNNQFPSHLANLYYDKRISGYSLSIVGPNKELPSLHTDWTLRTDFEKIEAEINSHSDFEYLGWEPSSSQPNLYSSKRIILVQKFPLKNGQYLVGYTDGTIAEVSANSRPALH